MAVNPTPLYPSAAPNLRSAVIQRPIVRFRPSDPIAQQSFHKRFQFARAFAFPVAQLRQNELQFIHLPTRLRYELFKVWDRRLT